VKCAALDSALAVVVVVVVAIDMPGFAVGTMLVDSARDCCDSAAERKMKRRDEVVFATAERTMKAMIGIPASWYSNSGTLRVMLWM
jgi:hypothetical protein